MFGFSRLGLQQFGLGTTGSSKSSPLFQPIDLLRPSAYTGGAMSVLDTDGVLQSVAVNDPAYQGATFAAGDFSRPINQAAAYPVGLVSKPATTNKVTCRKFNPVDTTNITLSGDVAATLTVVDDSVELATAGLDQICTSGKVYKLDNSGGAANAQATITGVTDNTNLHSMSVYCRFAGSTGVIRFNSGVGSTALPLSASYVLATSLSQTPFGVGDQLNLRVEAGGVLYFIIPRMVESPLLLPTEHDATDPLTAITSAATVSTYSASLLQSQNTGIDFYCEPMGAGQTEVLWGSYVDADNYTQVFLNPTDITLRKRVSATSHDAVLTYSHSTTGFRLQAYWSDAGLGVTVLEDGGSWETWATDADTTAAQLDTTFEAGSDGDGGNQTAGFLGGTSGKLKVFTAASGVELIAKMEAAR